VTDPLPTFAQNLRRMRRAKGLTQAQLAEAAGLNTTHVARIERCQRDPGVTVVSNLALGLGVTADVLFVGVEGRWQDPST
jgi:transcriptional regulator with XRE-family HTH domain